MTIMMVAIISNVTGMICYRYENIQNFSEKPCVPVACHHAIMRIGK
jgi:ABC-type enterochelin transport system permease subunit